MVKIVRLNACRRFCSLSRPHTQIFIYRLEVLRDFRGRPTLRSLIASRSFGSIIHTIPTFVAFKQPLLIIARTLVRVTFKRRAASDLDLQAGNATVRRTLVWRKGGGWYSGEPKTSRSRRTIPIPKSLVSKLADHRRRQAESEIEERGGLPK
jgi:hypothetical protein